MEANGFLRAFGLVRLGISFLFGLLDVKHMKSCVFLLVATHTDQKISQKFQMFEVGEAIGLMLACAWGHSKQQLFWVPGIPSPRARQLLRERKGGRRHCLNKRCLSDGFWDFIWGALDGPSKIQI